MIKVNYPENGELRQHQEYDDVCAQQPHSAEALRRNFVDAGCRYRRTIAEMIWKEILVHYRNE